MAVQARYNTNNLFCSSHQFVLANRDFLRINQETSNRINNQGSFATYYNSQSQNIVSKAMNKQSDSGLTFNATNPGPRKRPRDHSFPQETTTRNDIELFAASNTHKQTKISRDYPFVNDTAFQIQQHQGEIDRVVARHTESVRAEMEKQRKKREAGIVLTAFEEGIAKRLKEKDEEIIRMGKLNWVLQERVKTLCVENQLWKDLAQSNEATAISLRTNLEQVLLAHVSPPTAEQMQNDAAAAEEEAGDAESCCRENDGENGVVRTCRGCGEEEARVLGLPCRHLCLCATCGSRLRHCPVCNSLMTASVRVNFS